MIPSDVDGGRPRAVGDVSRALNRAPDEEKDHASDGSSNTRGAAVDAPDHRPVSGHRPEARQTIMRRGDHRLLEIDPREARTEIARAVASRWRPLATSANRARLPSRRGRNARPGSA